MPYNKEIITEYINSLNEIQKLALKIAKEDLGSSFNIEKELELPIKIVSVGPDRKQTIPR